jgi:hypothetical protein
MPQKRIIITKPRETEVFSRDFHQFSMREKQANGSLVGPEETTNAHRNSERHAQ